MRLIRKLSAGGMTTPCLILNNELLMHQLVCNQLSRRISTRRMVTAEPPPVKQRVPAAMLAAMPAEMSAASSKLSVSNALPLVAIRLKNTLAKNSNNLPFIRSSNHSNRTQQSKNRSNTTQISNHRQLSTSSQCNQPNGTDEKFLPETYEKPYGTHKSSGAVLDSCVTNKMGVLWAFALVIPAIYLGGMLSSWTANTLSEYDIFVVDDDDDDD